MHYIYCGKHQNESMQLTLAHALPQAFFLILSDFALELSGTFILVRDARTV
jgi:hypothetical protein